MALRCAARVRRDAIAASSTRSCRRVPETPAAINRSSRRAELAGSANSASFIARTRSPSTRTRRIIAPIPMQPVDIRRFQEAGDRAARAKAAHRRRAAVAPSLPVLAGGAAAAAAAAGADHGATAGSSRPSAHPLLRGGGAPAQRLRSKLPPSRRADERPEAVLLNFHTSDNTLAVSRLVDSHPREIRRRRVGRRRRRALADAADAAAREVGYHAAGQRPYGTTLLLRSRVRLADGAPLTADAFGVGRVLRLRADHGPPYPRHRPTHALPAADEWLLDFGGRDVKIVRPLDAPTEAWAVGAGAAASAASRSGGAQSRRPPRSTPRTTTRTARTTTTTTRRPPPRRTLGGWPLSPRRPRACDSRAGRGRRPAQRAAAPRAAWTEASLEERAAAMTAAMAATREGKAAAAEAARVRTDATIADAKASVAAAASAEQRDPDELTARLADGYKARALITGGGVDEGSSTGWRRPRRRRAAARARRRRGGGGRKRQARHVRLFHRFLERWAGGRAEGVGHRRHDARRRRRAARRPEAAARRRRAVAAAAVAADRAD